MDFCKWVFFGIRVLVHEIHPWISCETEFLLLGFVLNCREKKKKKKRERMKAGKDEEKIMGPMFPRLHVNDTEKGGPRAPPRNKMALYEQLSIPSQRFNPGVLPLTHPNNTSSMVLTASSSQVIVTC